MKRCQECTYLNSDSALFCGRCGYHFNPPIPDQKTIIQPNLSSYNPAFSYNNRRVDRVACGFFAIFLGGLGLHKFMMYGFARGILYLVFCWTLIPSLVGFLEGIRYLCLTDEQFAEILSRPDRESSLY